MVRTLTPDLCVIGAGSGGLSVAAGASQMGASVVLIEEAKMGGDCLNYGCVPSKALLAAGRAARAVREARRFGVLADGHGVDARRVFGRVRDVIAAIAPHDSVERFEGLGVTVIKARARFVGEREVEAADARVRARRFVIATGSRPFVPPIPGLADVPYDTNETVFDADRIPEHLVVIGGGPIGVEMAQAHRDLGARVTVLELLTVLPNDDPELAGVVKTQLLKDGIDIREGVNIVRVETGADGIACVLGGDGAERRVVGSRLLVAAGRRAAVGDMGLEAAGVAYSAKGIEVDSRLRTSNRRVFAVGDAAGGHQFTHLAGYHAGVVIKNALFRIPARADVRCLPWVTYTRPELAQVGLTEARAREEDPNLRVLRWPFHDNDRAQTDGAVDGLVKATATKKGRILGCGIVGAHAGELIQTWALAMSRKLGIGALAAFIAPYPTFGEASKRAAGSFYAPTLFGERTRKLVRLLARLG
jgi:pyruvate/2-oxoglutarate dehydrogenase complex dihydrolipoamide dehydrogenase (E3) component